MNSNDIKEFVLNNPKDVSMKPTGDDLFILKYKKSVFFKNRWNDILKECRGTIVDSAFNPVQLPFTKIHNFRVESGAPVIDDNEQVVAYRKINGFMASITMYNGKLLISTTGSTTSDYVRMIEELIPDMDAMKKHCESYKDYTWLFEACHENDPHVVPEKAGLYLLAWRKKEWGSKVEVDSTAQVLFSGDLKTHVVESYNCTMGEVMQMAKECKHEGFCVYTTDGRATKIKSPYYLIKKWLARNPNTDKIINDSFLIAIDEEYYELVYHIRNNIVQYTAMNEQERLQYIREFLNGH